MQPRPHLETTEESVKLPILIIDKNGMIGKDLAKKLCEESLVVLVAPGTIATHSKIIHLPYKHRIPKVPDHAYANIFVIYNGEKEHLEMLPGFLAKARQSQGKVIFVTPLLYSSVKLFSYLHHQAFRELQIIVYGETFGQGSTEVNETNFYIQQIKQYGRIEVPNAGLGKLFPILYEDVISVIAATLAIPQQHRILFAFSHYPTTQISVARLLQKIDPMIKTDFKKMRYRAREYYVPQGGVYYFQNYNLEEKLRTVDLSRTATKATKPQKKVKLHLPDPDAKRRRFLLVGTLLFAVFIAPIILTLLLSLLGAGFLGLSVSQAEKGQIAMAQQSAAVSSSTLNAANNLIPGLVLMQLVTPQLQEQFADKVQIGQDVVDAESEVLTSMQIVDNIYEGKSLDPKNDFYRALATLKNTLITLQKMEAENRLPQQIEDKLQEYSGIQQLVEGTIDTWPSLLGFEGKRTYLVLFQNNMELRPGGGFIGSYGILNIQNGKMDKIQIHDVYDADGQLKRRIEPPYGLRRYMGAPNWFMRDSNFDLDNPRNAVQEAQFLKLETGQSVDGVIAIDTTFLQNLIGVLGKVNVPDYDQVVTADNFYLMTQNHAEKDFFPGSTQKKDFLRSLTNGLMIQILDEHAFSFEKLLKATETSIRQKHVLFAFADDGIQNVFAVNGLSSTLKDGRVVDGNTFLDFFSVMDANVGLNKANYYVKRSVIQQVAFDGAGGLQTTAEVSYTNSSSKGSPYGGDYKNYVRFVVPGNAVLQNISIDNVQQSAVPAEIDSGIYTQPDYVAPSGLEIEQTAAFDKKVIGFFFIVPAGQTKNIMISYTIPSVINLQESSFSYDLRLFKQPGAGEDPYTLFLSYPNGFKPIQENSKATDLGGKLVFDTKMDQDKDLMVSFTKK